MCSYLKRLCALRMELTFMWTTKLKVTQETQTDTWEMAESVPVSVAPSTSAPSVKRRKNKPGASKTPKKTDGTLSEKIIKVVGSSKERNGTSLVALKKALGADGYNLQRYSVRINSAVKRLVASGNFVQTKGTGAAGSFKLNKEKSAKVKKSTSPRKVVKTTIKSQAEKKATKKPAVKKVVRKVSPKKPKRPIAASSKRFSKSPAKVKKNVKKVLPKTKTNTKTTKPKSKLATKGLKNKKATLKKK
uniref:histone H1-like n=1 Tax=Myxine glutinosa TaxID=7769 RepID=UPI0035902082